jgi:transcriptional regulator with XRE-family HTH domain
MGEPIIGQRIRTLREQQGMSQAALARALGASANAVNYIELGSTKAPHIDRLIAIADLFNVSLDYLVGRSDDPRPPRRKKPAQGDDAKEEAA